MILGKKERKDMIMNKTEQLIQAETLLNPEKTDTSVSSIDIEQKNTNYQKLKLFSGETLN